MRRSTARRYRRHPGARRHGRRRTLGQMDDDAGQPDDAHAPPRPVDRFRRTAVGTVVAAGLLGLRDALEGRPERDEVAIVDEAPTDRVEPGFRLVFDEDAGRVTVVLPEPLPDEDPRRLL